MHAYTINVKSNPLMRQSRVESDIALGVALGGVGFWQEIAPSRYKAALARRAREVGCSVYGLEVECPVTLRDAYWQVDEHDVYEHKMHGGLAHVSQARYSVVVKARARQGPRQRKTAFVGKHMVSKAFSNEPKILPTKAWRQEHWNIDHAKTVEIVAELVAEGYDVVMGMDANRTITRMPKFHPGQVIVAANGIDGIIAVPAFGSILASGLPRVMGEGHFTDHDPVSVDVNFT